MKFSVLMWDCCWKRFFVFAEHDYVTTTHEIERAYHYSYTTSIPKEWWWMDVKSARDIKSDYKKAFILPSFIAYLFLLPHDINRKLRTKKHSEIIF